MKDPRDESRELILNSAIKIFAERGYHNSSLRDIGQDCNVYPSMIIYYFSSKEGLLQVIIKRIKEQIEGCAKIVSCIGFPKECLSFLIGSTVNWLIESESLARIFFQELSLSQNKCGDSAIREILLIHQNLFFKNLKIVRMNNNCFIQTDSVALYHLIFGSIVSYWSTCCGGLDGRQKLKDMSVEVERLWLR